MKLKLAVQNTDWALFAEQKQWLIGQAGDDTQPGSVYANGLLNFIDSLQDAIVEDGLLSEQAMFSPLT